MQKLGKNQGRYHGDTIDIDRVLSDFHRAAVEHGWGVETFHRADDFELRAYSRRFPGATKNLYLSSGIHGDEPAGPLALLQLLRENQWADLNLWLVPCVNPTGFRNNTRENSAGVDLNRDYRHLTAPEVRAHVAWLERQPTFDLTLILHEDWESNGFYIYELNPAKKRSLAGDIIDAVRELCPIESAELVDNWECRGGIIRPQADPTERPQWAESIYLIVNKAQQSYTLETPSDFPLSTRVQAQIAATKRAMELMLD